MNAEELLRHFERVADAPDALERVRRFVLDLAVRGMLVPRDPADEPAEFLMERLLADRRRRIASGEFREPSSLAELERERLPFSPPRHWRWARLIDLAQVTYGFAFASAQFNSTKRGMPLIRIRDISNTDTEAYFDGSFDAAYIVNPGDYLVGMDGAFNVRRWRGKAGLLNQRVLRLSDWRHRVEPEFIKLPLQFILDYLHGHTSQTTVKHLSAKQVNAIEIPLPPIQEQQRIVAKVDELGALCDRLEAARAEREAVRDQLAAASFGRLNRASPETVANDALFVLNALPALTARPDRVAQVKQAILSLAVRGELLPQRSDDQSAEAWYRVTTGRPMRALAERASSSPLPNGWISVPMEAVFEVAGGIQKTPDRTPRGNAFPYLGVANVYRGRLDLSIVKEFELAPGELERRRLLPGDLLIIEGNGSISEIGRCAKWSGEIADCVHQNHVIRCRPCDPSISDFILLVLNSPVGMANMQRLAITSSGLFSLSVGKIRQIEIALPPLAEQRRIVAKVKELMGLCDQLAASLNASDDRRTRLLDALIHQALESDDHFDEHVGFGERTVA